MAELPRVAVASFHDGWVHQDALVIFLEQTKHWRQRRALELSRRGVALAVSKQERKHNVHGIHACLTQSDQNQNDTTLKEAADLRASSQPTVLRLFLESSILTKIPSGFMGAGNHIETSLRIHSDTRH